jgi:UPF0716 protein FxsA
VILLLVILLVAVPVAELATFVFVGSHIGYPETIAVMLVVSIVGVFLVKRAGVGVWGRIRDQWASGVMPTTDLLDAGLIVLAGTLLILPGFLSDIVGLLLLVPLTRSGVRGLLRRHFVGKIAIRNYTVRRPSAGPEWRPPAAPRDPYELS